MKKTTKNNKEKMVLGGTPIKTKTPSEISNLFRLNTEQAQAAASTDNTVLGLKTLGGVMSGLGMGMASRSLSNMEDTEGFTKFIQDNIGTIKDINNLNLGEKSVATGGSGNNLVNAEGGEVIEDELGNVIELKGPSHNKGGIDVIAESVFSKRLKGDDGKTMAERKIKREKKENKLKKLLDKNPNDKLIKQSYDKTVKDNEIQNQQDLSKMNFVRALTQMSKQFVFGGTTEDPPDNPLYEGILPKLYSGLNENAVRKQLGLFQYYYPNYELNLSTPEGRSDFQTFLGGDLKADSFYGKNTFDAVDNANLVMGINDQNSTYGKLQRGEYIPSKANLLYNEPIDASLNLGVKDYKPKAKNDNKDNIVTNYNVVTNDIEDKKNINEKNKKEKTKKDSFLNRLFENITTGDALGLTGTMISSLGPYLNTQKNRASDTPNINHYKNFGVDSLKTIDESKAYVKQLLESQLEDMNLSKASSKKSIRNSARSINTLRGLETMVDTKADQTRGNIYDNFAKQMMQIMQGQSNMEAMKDQAVMRGEESRDNADRHDKDNYSTQLGQDISTMGTGLQQGAELINAMKKRAVSNNLLKEIYPNFKADLRSGKITSQGVELVAKYSNIFQNMDKDMIPEVANKLYSNEYELNETQDKIIRKSDGKEVDLITGKVK